MTGADYWIEQTEQSRATLPIAANVDMLPDVSPLAADTDADLPDALAPILFQQDADTVLAVLDAAKLPGLPEILVGAGLHHASLYQGQMAARLADVAPYLVALPRDATLLRRLLTRGTGPWDWWDKAAATFLDTSATLDGVREHLRRLVHIPDGQGGYAFFRFWEADLLAAIAIADRPDFALPYRLFGPVDRFIAPQPYWDRVMLITANPTAPRPSGTGRIVLDDPLRAILRDVALNRFAKHLADSCAARFPALMDTVPPQTRFDFAQTCLAQARNLGMTKKAPATVWTEMCCLFGIGLVSDPQYAAIVRSVQGVQPTTQMQVAQGLYDWTCAFQTQAMGQQNACFKAALARIPDVLDAPKTLAPASFLAHIWPEKCSFLGQKAVDDLIAVVAQQSSDLPILTLRQQRAYLALTFFLGHDCRQDPLFPWIGKSLADQSDPGGRLVSRALIWLDAAQAALEPT